MKKIGRTDICFLAKRYIRVLQNKNVKRECPESTTVHGPNETGIICWAEMVSSP